MTELENSLKTLRGHLGPPKCDLNVLLLVSWVDLLDPGEEFLLVTGVAVLLQGVPYLLQLLIKHSQQSVLVRNAKNLKENYQ